MADKDSYEIRHMTGQDLETAIEWAAKEGWNPGLADARSFQAADRNGFLVGLLDGEPVASISAVSYGTEFAFIGMYIVRPDMRGRGYGWRIWQAAMGQVNGIPTGLDGVVAQQDNYRKSGFVLAHRNLRYGGEVSVAGAPDPNIQPVSGRLRAAVERYDRVHFPAARHAFLDSWLDPTLRQCLTYVEQGAVKGYGVIRPCREGRKVGPLFADRPDIAEALFQALCASGEGPVFLDPPEPNSEARVLVERHGMKPMFETARMYHGPAPELPLQRIFGITTFELG